MPKSIMPKPLKSKTKKIIRSKPFGCQYWSFQYVKDKVLEFIATRPGKTQSELFQRLSFISGPARIGLVLKELTEENKITFKMQARTRIYQVVAKQTIQ